MTTEQERATLIDQLLKLLDGIENDASATPYIRAQASIAKDMVRKLDTRKPDGQR